MAKGHALLIGLRNVAPSAYGGWAGDNGCWGCELDVENVRRILQPIGYQITELKTRWATSQSVLRALRRDAAELHSGDIFVLYFAGHAGQVFDTTNKKHKASEKNGEPFDGPCNALLAFDREIADHELNEIWATFRAGVRIVLLTDTRNAGIRHEKSRKVGSSAPFQPQWSREIEAAMKAQLIHFSGCRDGFTMAGYRSGGDYTMALCDAWASGGFHGSYPDLRARMLELIHNRSQKPEYREHGPIDNLFHNERPFTIDDHSRHLDEHEAKATIRFHHGRAVIRLHTSFGLTKGMTIPLARQQTYITVTEVGDDDQDGHAII